MHCEFGEMLEDMLHDRIVCGLSNPRIQRRLLTEPKLTFAKAVELSQSMESAEKNSKTILSQRDTAEVHLTRIICYRCGNKHSPDTCAFKESYCRKCSKKGHIARSCRSRQNNVNRQGTERTPTRPSKQPHGIKQVESTEAEEEQPDPVYNLFNLNNRQSTNPVKVSVTVHGQSLVMEIDIGASLSLNSEKTYLSVWTDSNSPPYNPQVLVYRPTQVKQLQF